MGIITPVFQQQEKSKIATEEWLSWFHGFCLAGVTLFVCLLLWAEVQPTLDLSVETL